MKLKQFKKLKTKRRKRKKKRWKNYVYKRNINKQEAYVDLSVTIITDLLNSDQELSRIRILPEINEIIDK